MPFTQGGHRSGVDVDLPLWGRGMGQPEQPSGTMHQGRDEIGADVLTGNRLPGQIGSGEHHRNPRPGCDAGSVELGRHASGAHRGSSPVGLHLQVSRVGDQGDAFGPRRRRWRCVEAVDVGEQDECLGAYQFGDQRRQTVVVAEPDLAGGHRVVLVDDGHHPQRQQSGECGRGVAVAAGPHEVVHGEQHLAHLQVVLGESLRIVGQQDSLPHRGGRLFAGQVPGAVWHAQGGESGGDGPGAHQDRFPAV